MIENPQIKEIFKEYKLWKNKLDNYLTECIALKESIREIYNLDNEITSKLIPFQDAVNSKIAQTKDMLAKIRIQEDESHYVKNRPDHVEHFRNKQDKLRKEMKKLHTEHLELLDNFFNEIIV